MVSINKDPGDLIPWNNLHISAQIENIVEGF